MAITLTSVSSGYNLSAINNNFQALQQALNNSIMWRTGGVAGETLMTRDIDMNGHTLLNLSSDPNNPESILTVEAADARYYNITGDVLEGVLDAGGNRITNLPSSSSESDAVAKRELSQETAQRQSADANLQSQITGDIPLEASAFSEISWHGQRIDNSLTIPADKNAWSFGPQMEIAEGQLVTISEGSTWTIADGRVVEDEDLHNLIADTIRTTDGAHTIDVANVASSTDLTALTSRVTAEENKVNDVSHGGTGASTASAARSNLGAAASGANTDITSITGSSAKLTTPRNLQTNLASTSASPFDGTADTSLGVTGILPATNGGTGNTLNQSASTIQLATSRTIQTNLASTSATGFNGTANITVGVTGTLPLANGGTGGTTAAAARTSLGAAASVGVTDASSAAAGVVGQVLEATTGGTTTAITSATPTNLISLSLTAGDWDVVGLARFNTSDANINTMLVGINTTSATVPGFPNTYQLMATLNPSTQQVNVPAQRINVAATTTIYLVAQVAFPSGSVTTQGYIRARRAR